MQGANAVQAPSQALQQGLKDLERAHKNFFEKRAAFPKFKMTLLRPRRQGKPENASSIRVRRLRLQKQRRRGRCNEYIGAGIPRCSLWRRRLWPCAKPQDETSLNETGTHRSGWMRGNSRLATARRRNAMRRWWPRAGRRALSARTVPARATARLSARACSIGGTRPAASKLR